MRSANGRYLQRANGTPFIVIGDTPWSLPVQCTNTQILAYLNDRAAKGCTGILFNAIEHGYSNQSPVWKNVDGVAPFSSMSPIDWVMNNTYWQRVDFIVNEAKARGMVCFICPAYTGCCGDGWSFEYSTAADSALRAYGAALAQRYTQGNVVWVMGGDTADDGGKVGSYGSSATPNRTKQWQIVMGIRSVRTTDLITGHTGRNLYGGAVDGESYKAWGDGTYAGWNLNNVYGREDVDDAPGLSATAWSRPGPLPFFLIEAGYENTDGQSGSMRIPALQTVLSGGLGGYFGGHDVLWHMGSLSPENYGAATALGNYLTSSWRELGWFGNLLRSYAWHKLVPQRGTALVTTSLGSGVNTICPSLASDGSVAMIFVPGPATFTVNMAAMAMASVRARWYDTRSGSFTLVTGSPFINSGTRSFSSPGERILVLDAG